MELFIMEVVIFISILTTALASVRQHMYHPHSTCPGQIMLSSYTYEMVLGISRIRCGTKCSSDAQCLSFQYEASSRMCTLNSEADHGNCSMMTSSNSMVYYIKEKEEEEEGCANGGISQSDGSCACTGGYVGETCKRFMKDCNEGFVSANGYENGVFYISPDASPAPFPVFCNMRTNGRTQIMTRDKTVENFDRPWNDYKDGFGDLLGDHWLGLQKLYEITEGGRYILTIKFNLQNGTTYHIRYYGFKVEDEANKYRMTFSKIESVSAPFDCLTPLNGSYFSTSDQDNDNSAARHCAQDFQAGWWFNACADCNPTGRLLRPTDDMRTGVDYEVFWTNGFGNIVPFKVSMWLIQETV